MAKCLFSRTILIGFFNRGIILNFNLSRNEIIEPNNDEANDGERMTGLRKKSAMYTFNILVICQR